MKSGMSRRSAIAGAWFAGLLGPVLGPRALGAEENVAERQSVSEQLAIVTGTSSGIGAALAQRLLADGWHVVGLARRDVDLGHREYEHVQLDLANLHALETLAEKRLAPLMREPRWQRVGLVNNAAIAGPQSGVERTDPKELARLLAVNTVAPTYLMGVAVRAVPVATPLRIANVSSGAAVRTVPGLGDYSASKAGLRMTSMALAMELESAQRPGGPRPNAAVLSYQPGVVDTPMQVEARSGTPEEAPWNQLFKDFAEQGMLQPPEAVIGPIVTFLGSESSPAFVEKRFGE